MEAFILDNFLTIILTVRGYFNILIKIFIEDGLKLEVNQVKGHIISVRELFSKGCGSKIKK